MILFYDPKDKYGCFSNFSRHPVQVFMREWRTSEHAFQAMKFDPHRPDLVEAVWAAKTPGKAAEIGRNRSLPLSPKWDDLVAKDPDCVLLLSDEVQRPGVQPEPCVHRWKDLVMFDTVLAKFVRNEDLKKELLSTGDQALVENAIHDPYWGWGASHVGENKLGRILMLVRQLIRTERVNWKPPQRPHPTGV